MPAEVTVTSNVKQAVPFLNVTDIEASLRFYVDGLGGVVTRRWVPEGASAGAGCNSTMRR
jgi:catechol 2,3-dioxygenase-like lactoylglutathione lyase family enzyme